MPAPNPYNELGQLWCNRCEGWKNSEKEFYQRYGKPSQPCRSCCIKQSAALKKQWREENPELAKQKYEEWYKHNREPYQELQRSRYHERRMRCLRHYGGPNPRCSCCGETHSEFLSIDHTDGGGNKHRQEIGYDIYRWLIKNNFPPRFRVLCMNCNTALGYRGYCPHQREVS